MTLSHYENFDGDTHIFRKHSEIMQKLNRMGYMESLEFLTTQALFILQGKSTVTITK